jgi:hypothetical protein
MKQVAFSIAFFRPESKAKRIIFQRVTGKTNISFNCRFYRLYFKEISEQGLG